VDHEWPRPNARFGDGQREADVVGPLRNRPIGILNDGAALELIWRGALLVDGHIEGAMKLVECRISGAALTVAAVRAGRDNTSVAQDEVAQLWRGRSGHCRGQALHTRHRILRGEDRRNGNGAGVDGLVGKVGAEASVLVPSLQKLCVGGLSVRQERREIRINHGCVAILATDVGAHVDGKGVGRREGLEGA
jgi:hypothetical protein